MKIVDTKERTSRREIMDDFELQGEELRKTLDDLDKVNKWLGGNKITLDGVEKIFKSACFAQPVSIMDVGCGNGSLLKEVADFARSHGIKMKLKGIDANEHTIEIARENTKAYPEITFEPQDIFSEEFKIQKVDIILCTLTMHHFKDKEIEEILPVFSNICQMGIVINDLQRSRFAYYLFEVFCAFFIKNEIARKDGLTSVLRGFKKEDLKWYGRNLNMRDQKIAWKWAFRYQWILLK